MDSVVPPEDKTPADGYRALSSELARIKNLVGEGNREGLRGDVLQINGALIELLGIVRSVDNAVVRSEGRRIADRLEDLELHEAERQADVKAAKVRHAELIEKLRLVTAGQVALAAVVVIGALFGRGCL